jgi:hypothetical protein
MQTRRKADVVSKRIAIKELPSGQWRVVYFDKHGAAQVHDVANYDAAVGAAHLIGRYKLGLGDLLFTYVDGLKKEDLE